MRVFCIAGFALWAYAACTAGERLRVDTQLVLINATVTDRDGHFVSGLARQDFRLYQDGQPQRIVSFSQEDAPVSVGIVFDSSGSMSASLELAKQALRHFLDAGGREDEFALAVVKDRPDWALHFTREPAEVLAGMSGLRAGGSTALHDAMYLALQRMKQARNPRRALLVVSDGLDNHSRYTDSELMSMLRETDVTVYAIGLYRAFPDEAALGRQLLQDMADSTGGLYLEAGGPRDLPKIISKIDIRNEYVLGMTPAGLQADGKDHNVNLKLERDARTRKLRASWRRGYYAVGDIALPKFSLR